MLTRREIAGLVDEQSDPVPLAALTEMAVPSYLHRNPLVRWIIRKRLHQLARMIEGKSARFVLDFGCGLGLLGHELQGSLDRMYLCDIELRPVRALVRDHAVHNATLLLPAEVEDNVEDGSLDVIVAADVFEHFESEEEIVETCRQFARKLTVQGRLLLSGPTESLAYRTARWIAGFCGDYHHRDVFALERLLGHEGWVRDDVVSLPDWSPMPLFRVSSWHRSA